MNFLIVSKILLLCTVCGLYDVKADKGYCAKVFKNGKWEMYGDCDKKVQSQVLKELDDKLYKICYGGFRYNGLCYWAVVRDSGMNFAEAETTCRERNGVPAYPLNEEHYKMMITVIEKVTKGHKCKLEFRSLCYVWTSLIYDFTPLHDMSLPDGSPAPYQKMWYQRGGTNSNRIGMLIGQPDSLGTTNGMENWYATANLPGVFCQELKQMSDVPL